MTAAAGVSLLMSALAVGLLTAAPAWGTCHMASFSPSDYEVGEPDGMVTLTVRNPGINPRPRTIDFTTVSGAAAAGEDFLAASGTLSFSATQNERMIVISILDDADDETAETFQVRLETKDGSCISQPGEPASITIRDDDTGALAAGPKPSSKASGLKPKAAAAEPSPSASPTQKPATRKAPGPEPGDAYGRALPAGRSGRGALGRVDGWSIAASLVLGIATGVWIWRRFARAPGIPDRAVRSPIEAP